MSQQIVHNTGINYTLYYNILNYFRTILKNHPSIGVATYGDLTDFDTKEFPAYPVGNVLITNSEFGTNVTTYTVQLTVADKIKNKNNESSGSLNQQSIDYFKGVDDTIDIHNNTLGILNDLTSYTQRGVAGFEIDGEIGCVPFSDRFNNGLAGWVATFSLTTHNDKNRCLFFLVNPSGSGYVIEECETGDRYKAVLNESGSIGQVFSSKYTLDSNGGTTSYDNLKCYTILEQINDTDDWDFVNLKVLALPFNNYGTCEVCELWISPKIWSTTPQTWNSGSNVVTRTWSQN
jgi:hypothetical protein